MGGCAISSLPSPPASIDLPPHKHPSSGGAASTPQNDLLTDDERKVVLETWALLSSSSSAGGVEGGSTTTTTTQETGVRILLRFFQLVPDAKNAFPSFRNLEESILPRNILFRSHALRFMRAVEAVMINIDLLELTVIPNLLCLGRRHACIDGFKAKYLAVLEDAMIDVWNEVLGARFDRTARKAWPKVFHFIAEQLFQGIQQQTEQMQQQQQQQQRMMMIQDSDSII